MPTLLGRNWQLPELQAHWDVLREARLSLLGSAATILPIGDPRHGQPNASTFKTVGAEQVTFTWSDSGGPAAFDTKFDLTAPASYQGIIPIVRLNTAGVDDEEADSPDAAFLTTIATEKFTLLVWIRPRAVSSVIMSKWDNGTPDREWLFGVDGNGDAEIQVYDESNNANIGRKIDTALTFNQWVHLVARYDGGTDAANIDLFKDGSEADDANVADDAGFVSMVDGGEAVTLGARGDGGTASTFFDGDIAGGPFGPVFIDGAEASDDVILRDYQLGLGPLAL